MLMFRLLHASMLIISLVLLLFSIFIVIAGVVFPKILSDEQKIAMNNQRAVDTYAFLKDESANPYAGKE